jgi:predicted dehydrogenase
MTRRTIGIVMNGVTGRMGYRQHLVRSILALCEQGGLPLADGTLIWPEPVLVDRNAEKLKSIAERHSLANWTTELDSALGDPGNEIYFDAQLTQLRYPAAP